MVRIALATAVMLLLMPCVSIGSDQPDKLATLLEQQRALQSDLADGKLELTTRQLNLVRKAQDEVFALTAGKTSLDQLSIEERVRLENALERVNAQVKGGDLDRLARGEQEICRRERRTGSKVKVTVCATQAEWDLMRDGARATLEKQHVCTPPGCGE